MLYNENLHEEEQHLIQRLPSKQREEKSTGN